MEGSETCGKVKVEWHTPPPRNIQKQKLSCHWGTVVPVGTLNLFIIQNQGRESCCYDKAFLIKFCGLKHSQGSWAEHIWLDSQVEANEQFNISTGIPVVVLIEQ